MQYLSLLLAAALVASTAAAQTSPTAPGSAGPSFAESDTLPDTPGYDDAYAMYEIRVGGQAISEDQQVTRWQQELKAGRARAGALVGSYLAYRALTPADCTVARDLLKRADDLGSDQAAWSLAELGRNSSCGVPLDRTQIEPWLKKAVVQDYFSAALKLMAFYADEAHGDPLQRYVYARVAGGYAEAVAPTEPRPGYDATALKDMEATLSSSDRAKAQTEATAILGQMLKRHQRFVKVLPVEFTRGGKGGQEFVASTVDYRHECQFNLRSQCTGAQRLVFFDVTNKSADFLSCKIALKTADFAGGAIIDLSRSFLIGPKVTRKLALGDVNAQPDKKAVTVDCTPVPNLAANAIAGKCRAKLSNTINAENFYPPDARNRGTEGSAVVRYFVPAGADAATDAEIVTSTGDASLDDAAIATIRSGKFTSDCAYGLGTIRIAFKLSN